MTGTDGGAGWFKALGSPIPEEQRERAKSEVREMGYEGDVEWVDTIAKYVELDQPNEAIEATKGYLDVTGTYRFLAALCVEQKEKCAECDEVISRPAVTEHRGRAEDLKFCSAGCYSSWRFEYSVELLKEGVFQ